MDSFYEMSSRKVTLVYDTYKIYMSLKAKKKCGGSQRECTFYIFFFIFDIFTIFLDEKVKERKKRINAEKGM